MFFDHYPYTNFHNVNLDWVLQAVKSWGAMVEANNQGFIDLKAANASFKDYVTHYLQNLDVSDEIDDKLDRMLADGVLAPYMAPYIQTDVSAWLTQHITPTTPAVDNSLTVSRAAADAKVTGDKLMARFGILYTDATAITATAEDPKDLNEYRDVGTYRVSNVSNASHIANIPYVSGGLLVVMSQAANAKVQWFFPNVQRAHIYIRFFSSSAWGDWLDATPSIDSAPVRNSDNLVTSGGVFNALTERMGLTYENATTITATAENPADLNDYKDVGNYHISNATIAANIANIPYVSAGYLVVMSQTANARVQWFFPNVQRAHIYIRFFSSSAWGDWLDATPSIDSSPVRNSDNLVTSGGVFDAIETATIGNYTSGMIWEQGVFNSTEGKKDSISRIRTNWFDAGAITYAAALEGYELYAYRLSEGGEVRAWNGVTWQPHTGAWVTSVNLASVRNYKTRFLARNANAPTDIIKPDEGINIVLTGKLAEINRNGMDLLEDKTLIPNSYGLANVLAKFDRMLNIEWTPVSDIPAVGSFGVFTAGVTYKGMLYSSTRLIGKVVGLDVSFKTFLTAMKNPRSVLYTKRVTYNLGKAYYGSTCASCIDYAMGWGTNYVGSGIMAKPEVSKQNYINLQSGDILYSRREGHLIMVHNVYKDEYGRPQYVIYDEGFMPRARQLMQAYPIFVRDRTERGYIVLRNNAIGDTDYPAEPYVKGYPDEVPEGVPDYDIMCNYGDEAVLLEGTSVTINVLNATGYSRIEVYKNNTLIQTVANMADFTLSDLAYGEYRVSIVGDDRESSTSFVIVQATCTWNAETHILTFSSENATPRVVWLNDNGTSAFTMYDVDVTDEDIENGYIDLTDAFTEHPDMVNVRMDFKYNGYTASWFSYFNPAWVIDV